MRRTLLLLPVAFAIAGLSGAAAGELERYRLEKTETGYVRMDTSTGEMSVCQEKDGQLVCRATVEERAAFQDEIERLQARLTDLETRVAGLEARPAIPDALLPSDEQFDKSMELMEKFFHRFMGIVKDLDDEKTGSGADLQKT